MKLVPRITMTVTSLKAPKYNHAWANEAASVVDREV